MSRRRHRGLRPEEEELWNRVTRSLTPMHPAPPRPLTDGHDFARSVKHDPTAPAPLSEFRLGQAARPHRPGHDIAPTVAEHLSTAPVRMDRKAYLKLTRGKLVPEGRLDLHGMTLAEAHPELVRFILTSHSAGRRLVLVITGKGRDDAGDGPIPRRRGVLRHQVPQWLAAPPLGSAVLQVTAAHRKHGGEGALYVYLRRASVLLNQG